MKTHILEPNFCDLKITNRVYNRVVGIFAKIMDTLIAVPALIAIGVGGFLFFGAIGLYERRHR